MGKFMGGEPSMAAKIHKKFGVSTGATAGGKDRGPKVKTTGTAATGTGNTNTTGMNRHTAGKSGTKPRMK